MTLRRMPNGAYVDVPDDITPEGLARISAQYAPKRTAAPATGAKPVAASSAPALSPRDKRIAEIRARRANRFKMPWEDTSEAFQDNLVHATTLGVDDVVGAGMLAGTEGAYRAIRDRDIGQIGETYSAARAAAKLDREDQKENHPFASGAGSIVGIFTNPIGAETGAARLAAAGGRALKKAVPASARAVDAAGKLAAAARASKAGQAVARAGGSTIGVGARSGFNQGFVTGLTDTGNLDDALNEGAQGALYGGAASALLGAGAKAYRIIRNQSPEQAGRVALERVAQMLDRSEDPLTRAPYTGTSAAREIRATDAAGGDAMLADLTPEAQSWASYLAKQPGNRAAAGFINRAEDRLGNAANRFEARVRKQLGIVNDAYDTEKLVTAGRKAASARDYSKDVMDRQLAWSDELTKFFKKDNPFVRSALRQAETLIRGEDGDVTQLAFSKMQDPTNSTMVRVPSMGVMDKVKKAFDAKIGKALKDGNREEARMFSMQLRILKDELAKVNPEYARAVANQKDFFERANSIELGEDILKRLSGKRSDVRRLLDDIKASNIKPDDIKIGFADALMSLRTKGDNPVAKMRAIMRSDEQRAVLAQLFGGHKNLNDFARFMRRELRSVDTDQMVASGRQMQANLLREPPTVSDIDTVADIGKAGMQGAAFGGPVGAVSRMLSSTQKWSQFLSPASKEELTKLLSGKGEGLEEALKKLRREAMQRKILDRKRAAAAGKLPNAVVGGYSEQ